MRQYKETDSSINDILEMFRNYRHEEQNQQVSEFSFDSKVQFNHEEFDLVSPGLTIRQNNLSNNRQPTKSPRQSQF